MNKATNTIDGGDRRHCRCGDCGWSGSANRTGWIRNLPERVAPGETMPAGECPRCGALAYLWAPEFGTADSNLESHIRRLIALGFTEHSDEEGRKLAHQVPAMILEACARKVANIIHGPAKPGGSPPGKI